MASGSLASLAAAPEKVDDSHKASLQLSLKSGPSAGASCEEALKWREQALQLREELVARKEQDLDRREAELLLRESTFQKKLHPGDALRKLPCEMCNEGRVCGRAQPCYDGSGYLLHHHHNCTACHDARKAQRRANRAGRLF